MQSENHTHDDSQSHGLVQALIQ